MNKQGHTTVHHLEVAGKLLESKGNILVALYSPCWMVLTMLLVVVVAAVA